MGQRHKHADVIIAWANGETVQVRNSAMKGWVDLTVSAPTFTDDEYRIKPKLVIHKFRVALHKDSVYGGLYTCTADSPEGAGFCETERDFVRWITDWIEYGVEE